MANLTLESQLLELDKIISHHADILARMDQMKKDFRVVTALLDANQAFHRPNLNPGDIKAIQQSADNINFTDHSLVLKDLQTKSQRTGARASKPGQRGRTPTTLRAWKPAQSMTY